MRGRKCLVTDPLQFIVMLRRWRWPVRLWFIRPLTAATTHGTARSQSELDPPEQLACCPPTTHGAPASSDVLILAVWGFGPSLMRQKPSTTVSSVIFRFFDQRGLDADDQFRHHHHGRRAPTAFRPDRPRGSNTWNIGLGMANRLQRRIRRQFTHQIRLGRSHPERAQTYTGATPSPRPPSSLTPSPMAGSPAAWAPHQRPCQSRYRRRRSEKRSAAERHRSFTSAPMALHLMRPARLHRHQQVGRDRVHRRQTSPEHHLTGNSTAANAWVRNTDL